MQIAQIAPLYERVPPITYGGTERVVYHLTEALVAGGHEVTLFASGDSRTSARLLPMAEKALWHDPSIRDPVAPHVRMHAEVFARAGDFDVIHNHNDYFAFPYLDRTSTRVVTTMHGRCDLPELGRLLRAFPGANLISISEAQQRTCPDACWVGTVYHGVPTAQYRFDPEGGPGLVFLGRISPEKAPQVAIDVAVAAGLPLTIAARIDPTDRPFFEREVRPKLDHPLVRFVGEVDDAEKQRLLGSARALLLPIDWPEPFGLAMIEAMACGTPVVARPCGSAPELVEHGVTGFLAEDLDGLIRGVRMVPRLDRAACRRRVEERFSVRAMAEGYERIYRRLAAARLGAA